MAAAPSPSKFFCVTKEGKRVLKARFGELEVEFPPLHGGSTLFRHASYQH